MSDELQFTCIACGKDFDPDPDTMLESGITSIWSPAADDFAMVKNGEIFSAEKLAAMSDYELGEWGLTPADREKLLAGESVITGAVCICKECQDSLEDTQDSPEDYT